MTANAATVRQIVETAIARYLGYLPDGAIRSVTCGHDGQVVVDLTLGGYTAMTCTWTLAEAEYTATLPAYRNDYSGAVIYANLPEPAHKTTGGEVR